MTRFRFGRRAFAIGAAMIIAGACGIGVGAESASAVASPAGHYVLHVGSGGSGANFVLNTDGTWDTQTCEGEWISAGSAIALSSNPALCYLGDVALFVGKVTAKSISSPHNPGALKINSGLPQTWYAQRCGTGFKVTCVSP
jgi:hypothetical protein